MATPVSPDSIAPDRRAELDELFADLTDQRGSVDPVSDEEREARRRRLADRMAEAGTDALLVEPGPTLDWLTGLQLWRSERLVGLVQLADGKAFWIAPAFEVDRIAKAAKVPRAEVLGWDEHEYAFDPLVAELDRRHVVRLGIEPDVRHRFVCELERRLGREHVVPGGPLVQAVRARKDEHELALLRRANELTQQALRAVGERLEDGTTGRQLAEMVTWSQHRLGLVNIWNLSLVGAAAAYPHGDDAPTVVERGSYVLVDTGGALHGYQSDNTRSWVQGGGPDERFDGIWHAVRDAQQAAFEALRPGVPCRAADEAARRVLDARGFGPGYRCFTHRVGHGIGFEGHEGPYLDGGSEVLLEPGMTFSDEPGVYLPGELGLRIEDIVVVTEDGADHFGTWQQGPGSPA